MRLTEAVAQIEAELAQDTEAFKARLSRFPNVPPTKERPRSASHPVTLLLREMVACEVWVTYGWIPPAGDPRSFLPAVAGEWNEPTVVFSEAMTWLIHELDGEVAAEMRRAEPRAIEQGGDG